MITSTIYLIRHGQTRSNVTGFYMGRSDEDLDETGRKQATHLASSLAETPLAAVFSSPLRRALSTAMEMAAPRSLNTEVVNGLTEMDLGEWQGCHRDDIRSKWPELWKQWRSDPSGVTLTGGESLAMVGVRAFRAFEAIVKQAEGKTAAVVTHEVVIKTIAARVLGAPDGIYRRFEIGNASISTVIVFNGRYLLASLNDVAHLGSGWGNQPWRGER